MLQAHEFYENRASVTDISARFSMDDRRILHDIGEQLPRDRTYAVALLAGENMLRLRKPLQDYKWEISRERNAGYRAAVEGFFSHPCMQMEKHGAGFPRYCAPMGFANLVRFAFLLLSREPGLLRIKKSESERQKSDLDSLDVLTHFMSQGHFPGFIRKAIEGYCGTDPGRQSQNLDSCTQKLTCYVGAKYQPNYVY